MSLRIRACGKQISACHLSQLAVPGFPAPFVVGQSWSRWHSCCKDKELLGQGECGLKMPGEFMSELSLVNLTRIPCREVNFG